METTENLKPCCAARQRGEREADKPPVHQHPRGWIQTLAVLPAAVLSLLPSATCPFCIAAYAGVLSFLGLGFLLSEQVLVPLIATFLLFGVASVGWTTRSHRNPWPLVGTVAGSAGVALGRLVWNISAVLYVGVALIVASSLWNLWLKRPRRTSIVCIERATTGSESAESAS